MNIELLTEILDYLKFSHYKYIVKHDRIDPDLNKLIEKIEKIKNDIVNGQH